MNGFGAAALEPAGGVSGAGDTWLDGSSGGAGTGSRSDRLGATEADFEISGRKTGPPTLAGSDGRAMPLKSSRMVPVPSPSAIIAPLGLLNVARKVSPAPSGMRSLVITTVKVCTVVPGAKVNVPAVA